MNLTKRSSALCTSQTVGIANIVMEMTRSGREVLALNEGELDFDTPEPIISATSEALQQGRTRYSFLNGEDLLREQICRKLMRENGIEARPEEILVTNGSKQVIYELIHTLVEEGDEVIIPVPCWPTYIDVVRLAGGTPVLVDIGHNDLDVEAVSRQIRATTKLVIINSPNNPTGAVYSRASLIALCNTLRAKSIYVISDEAYERITFDGTRAVSLGSLSECDPQYTITTQTFSKGYAMTGYRIGYAHAPEALVNKLSAMHSQMTDNVCTFAQYGAITALTMDQGLFARWRADLHKRRDIAVEHARALFTCTVPKGAFYIFPDVTAHLNGTISTSLDLAELILRECGVACVPGEAFFSPGHLRFSFAAASESIIDEAFRRIKRLLG